MNAATLIAILAAHSPASHVVDDSPQRVLETCPAHVVASFSELDDALRHLQNQLNDVRKRDQRHHLQDDLDVAQAAMQRARVTSCRAARDRDVIVVNPAPPPAPRPIVLSNQGADELTHAVRREAFDDSRLAVLTLGVRGVCVTSEQSKELVRELTFSNRKLDALRALAPRIVDRERAYMILESFTFESDKRAARDILNATPIASDCVMPRRA